MLLLFLTGNEPTRNAVSSGSHSKTVAIYCFSLLQSKKPQFPLAFSRHISLSTCVSFVDDTGTVSATVTRHLVAVGY